jgi:transcriptional regulator with XRE-family HTH domain
VSNPNHRGAHKQAFHWAMGEAIRRKRTELGIMQYKAAEAIGISASSLDNYEEGTTPAPSFVVWQLAHLFDCSTDELMVDPKKDVAA